MAAASPPPMSVAGSYRLCRTQSNTHFQCDLPPANVICNHAAANRCIKSTIIDLTDSDDDLQSPPLLSELGRSVLQQSSEIRLSPSEDTRPVQVKLVKSVSRVLKTAPLNNIITPAPSMRIRRVGLQGAPIRRGKRTPQNEGQHRWPQYDHSCSQESRTEPRYEQSPSYDQENMLVSIPESRNNITVPSNILVKLDAESVVKVQSVVRDFPVREWPDKAPLAQVSANTPLRPAPLPPPPKMSVLEIVTKASGASAIRKKSLRRTPFIVNGKSFQPLERCGKGGTAKVWRVQAENSKVFALKRVKLQRQDLTAMQEYKAEIDLLCQMKGNPRVVELFDYAVDDEKSCLYIVMELGEGDLNQVLSAHNSRDTLENNLSSSSKLAQNNTRTDFSFIRYWWTEMLHCVQAVHDDGIVHSDLKPANFLVVRGSLKLIDFGIAGNIDTGETVNIYRDNFAGTPNYMSPESLQDSSITNNPELADIQSRISVGKIMKIGRPSDVWSLGCILYQMVYGQPPFASFAPYMRKFLAIINPCEPINFPSTTPKGTCIPPELKRTMGHCLQRDAGKRPTVHELLAPENPWTHPESVPDLRISEHLLQQIISVMSERFGDASRPPPGDAEIVKYASSIYKKIRDWHEHV